MPPAAWRLLPLLCPGALAAQVVVSNTEQRRDTLGRLMDIHDGSISQWEEGGLYYWYGMGYMNCTEERGLLPPQDCPYIYKPFGGCGFRRDHAVRVYSSPDLVRWTLVSENALPLAERPDGIYFRVKVIYHRARQEFVLWVNYLADAPSPLIAYPNGTYVVAASQSPAGPFRVVTRSAAMRHHPGGGDFAVIVAENGSAYMAYHDDWPPHSSGVIVEPLTDDYHDSVCVSASDCVSTDPVGSGEAEALFHRGGWYYLTFGASCCFCREGSDVKVFAAKDPMGPWLPLGNIGQLANGSSATGAQQSFVITAVTADGGTEYIWTGDRWTSAPDKLKSHDFQYWQPLVFNDTASPPSIAPLARPWIDNFTIDMA